MSHLLTSYGLKYVGRLFVHLLPETGLKALEKQLLRVEGDVPCMYGSPCLNGRLINTLGMGLEKILPITTFDFNTH